MSESQDEMVEWMISNPGEAEAMIERYRERILEEAAQNKPVKVGMRFYDPPLEICSILSRLKVRSDLFIVSDRNVWDRESSLIYWSDSDLNLISRHFPNVSQAKAISDACKLVDFAEDAARGHLEHRRTGLKQ